MKLKHNGRGYLGAGISVTALASVLVAGCGGGGGGASGTSSGSSATGLAVSGKLVDGYVSGATVVLDVDDDRICSPTDPKTTTNASGSFAFTAAQNPNGGQHMICASGGTDASTALPLVGQLLAPSGTTLVTPLTNVVMAQVNSNLPAPVQGTASPAPGTTVATVSTAIANNLGLSGINLLTSDPVAMANSGALGGATLLAATAAVQVMLQQTAAAVAAATSAPAALTNNVYQNAANSMAAALATTKAGATPATALAAIANNMIANTVAKVAVDPAIIAAAPATASNAATLSPSSVAAFVAPTVTTLVTNVANSTNLLTTGATNPAAVAQSNANVANATKIIAALLTNTVANANTGSSATLLQNNLATLSNTIQTQLSGLSSGSTTVTSASAAIAAAISTATTNVAVPLTTVVPAVSPTTVTAAAGLQSACMISFTPGSSPISVYVTGAPSCAVSGAGTLGIMGLSATVADAAISATATTVAYAAITQVCNQFAPPPTAGAQLTSYLCRN